jgi:hypothetical protein
MRTIKERPLCGKQVELNKHESSTPLAGHQSRTHHLESLKTRSPRVCHRDTEDKRVGFAVCDGTYVYERIMDDILRACLFILRSHPTLAAALHVSRLDIDSPREG